MRARGRILIEQVEQLQQAVRNSFVSMAGTANTLQQQLRNTPPKWFSFSGHADGKFKGENTLAFTTASGDIAKVAPKHVASLLAECRRLEVVVINGCSSLELGQAIRNEGVPVVVCWRTQALDAAAALFNVRFFAALVDAQAQVMSLRERCAHAFEAAKRAVEIRSDASGALMYELRDPEPDIAWQQSQMRNSDPPLTKAPPLPFPLPAGIPELLM